MELNILLVDDESVLVEVLEYLLHRVGCTVTKAYDGLKGLKKFEQKAFDIVVSNLEMPHVNGLELARSIRNNNSEVPLIACSGLPDIEQVAINAGFDQFLSKPFSAKDLVDAMCCQFEKHDRMDAVEYLEKSKTVLL